MGAKQLAAIEHIIVLMLGNRSFDHMLSFRYETWAITRGPAMSWRSQASAASPCRGS
jgi:phospholipase C